MVWIAVGTLGVIGVLVYYVYFSPTSQVVGPVVARAKTSGKIIALSFDDGPNEPFTGAIADTLAKHSVHATFFCVGQNVERSPESLKRLARAGHAIGNHGYSHSITTQLSNSRAIKEVERTQEIIYSTIHERPALFRPPWFFRTSTMLSAVQKLGLTTVTGTFGSYLEVFQVPRGYMAQQAVKKVRPGTILVFHDGFDNKGGKRGETAGAVAILIPQLLQAGYTFVTIPELLSLPAYKGISPTVTSTVGPR